MSVAVALVVLLGIGVSGWLFVGTARGLDRRHVVVGGVPMDEVHPQSSAAGDMRPGVVVAHGYAGSAKLMAPFGDTLAAQGYVVVLLDFAGHGANTHRLPDDGDGEVLRQDLDLALAHLRRLPDVDPNRVALVGHSMGAGAVTDYALAHPEVTATAAISLPDAASLPEDRPKNLLLLVGGLEFPGFRAAVEQAVENGASDRAAVVVPGVEHISVLYAPRTHREVVAWLGRSFGQPGDETAIPSPVRRLGSAGLLMVSLLAGLYPLAHLLLGGTIRRPSEVPRMGRVLAVAVPVSGLGVVVGRVLPTVLLPLAIAGYVVGFMVVSGVAMLAYQRRSATAPGRTGQNSGLGRRRLIIATPVLIGCAGLTIAVPLQLGLTHAVPVGARWWLLAVVWAGFAVAAYGAERLSGGSTVGLLAVSAVQVVALTVAAVLGLTSGFLLLVVPLLAVLFLLQAIWSAVLHRFSAPDGLIAVVGSLLVAWPIAVTLPLIG